MLRQRMFPIGLILCAVAFLQHSKHKHARGRRSADATPEPKQDSDTEDDPMDVAQSGELESSPAKTVLSFEQLFPGTPWVVRVVQ
jgi:hypothetical protein